MSFQILSEPGDQQQKLIIIIIIIMIIIIIIKRYTVPYFLE